MSKKDSVFDKKSTVKLTESFYYRVGRVSTTKGWFRPNLYLIQDLLKFIKNDTDILDRYDIFLMGNAMWDIENTWDIDIQFVSDNYDLEQLEKDMDIVHDYSLNELRMLSDVQWRYRVHGAHDKKQLEKDNYFIVRSDVVKICDTDKKIGGRGEYYTIEHFIDEGYSTILNERVLKYHSKRYRLPDKIIERIKNTINDIIRFDFHIDEIIDISQSEFLKIKNNLK